MRLQLFNSGERPPLAAITILTVTRDQRPDRRCRTEEIDHGSNETSNTAPAGAQAQLPPRAVGDRARRRPRPALLRPLGLGAGAGTESDTADTAASAAGAPQPV